MSLPDKKSSIWARAAAKAAEPKGYKKKVTKKGNKTHFPKVGDKV